MRLFGFEFTRQAPTLRVPSDLSLESRAIQAVGELPARKERQASPAVALETRAVQSDSLGDWYLNLPSLLPPKQVEQILRGALAGNLWQATQLTQKMLDTWPMFKKCAMECLDSLSMVNFRVKPYVESEGDEPTETAKQKAAFITRCFKSFEPDRFKDEENFRGTIYDLGNAILNGVSIQELLYTPIVQGPDGKGERRIRASAWVHPRHYAINGDGSIGVADDGRADPLQFNALVNMPMLKNQDKFLVAKFKSKSGSPLGAGLMRCLAWYWIQIVYGRDFLLPFAQKYGGPFFGLPYTPGIDQSLIDKFEQIAKRAATQNWAIWPSNNPELKPMVLPPQSMAGDNPIVVMMRMADEACQILMLGQTLTTNTSGQGEGGGAYALGKVHSGVKQEKLEAMAEWMEDILEEQLVTSLLRVNWGNTDERPNVEADFTHVESPKEAADRMKVLKDAGIPVVADEGYKLLHLKQPKPGDTVLVNGQLSIQGEPMTPEDRQKQEMEMAQAMQPQQTGDTKAMGLTLRNSIIKASDKELAELETLVHKAQSAPHHNGEWEAVNVHIGKLARKRIEF